MLAKLLEAERGEPFARRADADFDAIAAVMRDLAAMAGVALPVYPARPQPPEPAPEPHNEVAMLVTETHW